MAVPRSILGEQLAGPLSDFVRNRRLSKRKKALYPEQRLWFTYIGNPLVIAGVTVFLVMVANSKPGKWNIVPDIGLAIAAFGVQIVATTCVTCKFRILTWIPFLGKGVPVSDKHPDCSDSSPRENSASLGVAINAVRLVWGFVSLHRIFIALSLEPFQQHLYHIFAKSAN